MIAHWKELFLYCKGEMEYVSEAGSDSFGLTYSEIEKMAGIPIDHSFLIYKKELAR